MEIACTKTDIAFSYVFSLPRDGKQTVNVFVAKGAESRSVEAVGTKIIADSEVSFGPKPNIVKSGGYTFFAGSRSDAFFFDFERNQEICSIPRAAGISPRRTWAARRHGPAWIQTRRPMCSRRRSSCRLANSAPNPLVRIWGRCSLRRDGKLLHVDRAGHPSVSSFFNTDETKEEYNASEHG